ncbi:MAG: hypothetical protein AB7S77_14065 [Desulfatirhabdiaceae bacterium]
MQKRMIGLLTMAAVFYSSIISQAPAIADTSVLTGDYFGSVAVSSPAGLGNIDLAFHLEFSSGSTIDPDHSYIILDKTILFPNSGQVDGKDVGPLIQSGSTFNGLVLNLITRDFTSTVSEKQTTRKLTLTGTSANVSGNSITGTYVETITGYLPKPMTVTGSFVLVRPVSITSGAHACQNLDLTNPIGELTLDEIKAGGNDPDRVEFEDISCALYFYHHPADGPSVSEATIGDAIADYKSFLLQQQ